MFFLGAITKYKAAKITRSTYLRRSDLYFSLYFSVRKRGPVRVHGQLQHQRGECVRPSQHGGHVPAPW
jgi:hypothetical protein